MRKAPCLLKDYEVKGMENIPKEGPALIIFYHGPSPIDMALFMAKLLLSENRLMATVGDRNMHKITGVFSLSSKMILAMYFRTPCMQSVQS